MFSSTHEQSLRNDMTEEEEESNLTKTDFALETQLCITCPKLSQGYYWIILNNTDSLQQ